ncbi:MAG: hypothetical protein ACD_4C00350G0004 [uncultured bacterium (gcode 4)]|uniref:Uncharacterized protein n=1 Tax=uncultured bacterium (gcode 4) TaxID=1234023 RepID=K2FTN5_9BACT|nr:MAG: hypothetical protein ACD_4C00350G0004 [uncultured bacterium (gcode 4)]
MLVENIYETDIITKIKTSILIESEEEKQNFINLISYFTPKELEELRLLI